MDEKEIIGLLKQLNLLDEIGDCLNCPILKQCEKIHPGTIDGECIFSTIKGLVE